MNEENKTDAPEAFTPMVDADMIALARSYVETGTGKGIKRNDLVRFMQTIVIAADAQPAPAAPTYDPPPGDQSWEERLNEMRDRMVERAAEQIESLQAKLTESEQMRASLEDSLREKMAQEYLATSVTNGLPALPEGDFSFLCSSLHPNDAGTSVHVGKRANRDFTRREAIAFALDMLRKVRAIP